MNQHVGRLDPDPDYLCEQQNHGVGTIVRSRSQLGQARLLDRPGLVSDKAKTSEITFEFSEGVRWNRCSFRRAQLLETLSCVPQFRVEIAYAQPNQGPLHPIDDSGFLAAQILVLAVRPLAILFLEGRQRRHAAVIRLAAQPAEKSTHEQSRVEPIGLGSAMVPLHGNAGRVDDIRFDVSRP
jgi:hypothetical protein